jgi:hypothetical protein
MCNHSDLLDNTLQCLCINTAKSVAETFQILKMKRRTKYCSSIYKFRHSIPESVF